MGLADIRDTVVDQCMLILISIYFKALSFVLTFLLIDDVLVSVSEKDIPESLIERLAEERYGFFYY